MTTEHAAPSPPTSARTPIPRTRIATRAPTSSSRSSSACGTAGRTMPWSATASAASGADRSKLHAPRFHGELLRRRGHPAVSPLAPGLAGARPGRSVGRRDRAGRPLRRAGLLGPAVTRGGGRVPYRSACAGGGRPAAILGPGARPPGADGDAGRDRGRGAGEGARARGRGKRRVPLAERALRHRPRPRRVRPRRAAAARVVRRRAPAEQRGGAAVRRGARAAGHCRCGSWPSI